MRSFVEVSQNWEDFIKPGVSQGVQFHHEILFQILLVSCFRYFVGSQEAFEESLQGMGAGVSNIRAIEVLELQVIVTRKIVAFIDVDHEFFLFLFVAHVVQSFWDRRPVMQHRLHLPFPGVGAHTSFIIFRIALVILLFRLLLFIIKRQVLASI